MGFDLLDTIAKGLQNVRPAPPPCINLFQLTCNSI